MSMAVTGIRYFSVSPLTGGVDTVFTIAGSLAMETPEGWEGLVGEVVELYGNGVFWLSTTTGGGGSIPGGGYFEFVSPLPLGNNQLQVLYAGSGSIDPCVTPVVPVQVGTAPPPNGEPVDVTPYLLGLVALFAATAFIAYKT